MQSVDDIGLLQQYATNGSESAFETLVNRRIGFVYSAALRQLGDPHQAEEVTQTVFIILARKAQRILNQTTLTGWLFNTTRFAALAHIRRAAKRRHHDQAFHTEIETESASIDPLWRQISPLLDEALTTLGNKDRQAILLRFFDEKSLAEVGNSLGVAEDAARKRVGRALEKLHHYFLRRGISSTTTLIGSAILTHSVQSAPATLAKSVTMMAILKGAAGRGSIFALMKGALKFMAWSKTQTALAGVAIASVATFSIVQHQGQSRLREQNQSLQREMQSLLADNERLSNQVSQGNTQPLQQPTPSEELLRLRGEVSVLRLQNTELKNLQAVSQNRQHQALTPVQPSMPLQDQYPKTPEAATRGIFDILAKGDFEAFFTNYAEPEVPKEMYDKMFNENFKKYLAGLEVISVGQPTNSFGPNMWFVPYKIRLQDGSEKEMQLHIAQDPRTQRWFFKGGI